MFHIALCDDQAAELGQTRNLVEQWMRQENLSGSISEFQSGAALLSCVEDGENFDVFLLDIILQGEKGTDIGCELRRLSRDGVIIYLTSSTEFALESFASYPLQYLIKPVAPEQLFEVLSRARELQQRRQQDTVLVHTASGELRLAVKDIQYAELQERKIQYHLTNGTTVETVTLRVSFADAVEMLTLRRNFLLSGSSYAVNLDHVQSVERADLLFYNGGRLKLPKKAHSEFRIAWMKYWLEGGEQLT